MELNRSSDFLTESENSTWIRRRTRLEKILMGALILGCAGILGLFVNVVRYEIDRDDTCDTPNCVLVAAQVLAQVDEFADPCEDFFLFACGNLVNATPVEHHPKALMENRIEKQLQNFLEDPVDEDDHPVFNYEKELYQACVADKNGTEAFETLKEIFGDLNGWPVVVGGGWDEKGFKWTDLAPKFYKRGLNHMQILHYVLEIDSKNSSQKTLTIYPPHLFLIERTRDMQQKVQVDVATTFGAEEEAARREMEEVMDFMWNVDKIKEKYSNYTHEDDLVTKARVSEFQKNHKEMDWLGYFNELTEPEYTIKLDDYFAFRHMDAVKAILELVEKTPKRTIANYMFWFAIDELLPFLTGEVFDFYNAQECLWGISRKTRTDVCKSIIRNNFSTLSSFIAYGKKYLTLNAQRRITDLFKRVKKEFKRRFEKITWMSAANKAKVYGNLNTMTEIVGMNNNTMAFSMYDKIFKKKLKSQDGFLRMYLNLKVEMNSVSHGLSLNDRWTDDILYINYIIDVETVYLRSQNAIILPVGALQDWYYDEEKPMYVNYATFGKSIGVIFANMMTGVHVFGEEDVQWTEETKKGFEEATHCIGRKHEDDPMTEYYDYKKLEVGQITGLKIAYDAYQEWVKDNGNELPAEGTRSTTAQLFWISALTDSCYEDDYGFTLYAHNEPLRQNPNFAVDFDCDIDSKMNPSTRCNIL